MKSVKIKLKSVDYQRFSSRLQQAVRIGAKAATLFFTRDAAGPQGDWFTLFVPPGTSRQAIDTAKGRIIWAEGKRVQGFFVLHLTPGFLEEHIRMPEAA